MELSESGMNGIIERKFLPISLDEDSREEDDWFVTRIKKIGSLKAWSDLYKYQRILIISEAGSGKTFECQQQQERMWEQGEAAFFIELSQLAVSSLDEMLSADERKRLNDWKVGGSTIATFFLDSFDELSFTQGQFKKALITLSKGVDELQHRIRVVITSRPVPFDELVAQKYLPMKGVVAKQAVPAEEFSRIVVYGASPAIQESHYWCRVRLEALTPTQARQLCIQQDISNPDALMLAIEKAGIAELSQRPQDIIEICSHWRERAVLGSLKEQIHESVRYKLKSRVLGGKLSGLSAERARDGVARLALAALLYRKLNFTYSVNYRKGAKSALDVARVLDDWTDEEINALLQRAVFGYVSYGMVRFHHLSIVHFLAAEKLKALLEKGFAISEVKRLIFGMTSAGFTVVKPTMRPVAAWLGLKDKNVFSKVISCDPSVMLIYGDPASLTVSAKKDVLCAYVRKSGAGECRTVVVPQNQAKRFSDPELAGTVAMLWSDVVDEKVRHFLLDLIALGVMRPCADIAMEMALNTTVSEICRIKAISALGMLPGVDFSPLVSNIRDDPQCWPDPVAFHLISYVFPRTMPLKELFVVLVRLEQKSNSYCKISLIDNIALLTVEELHELCNWLAERMIGTASYSGISKDFSSRYDSLVDILCFVCLRLITAADLSFELAKACVVATRAKLFDPHGSEAVGALRQKVSLLDRASKDLVDLARASIHEELVLSGRKEASLAIRDRAIGNGIVNPSAVPIVPLRRRRSELQATKVNLWLVFRERLKNNLSASLQDGRIEKTLRMLWMVGPREIYALINPEWNLELVEIHAGPEARACLEEALGKFWRTAKMGISSTDDKKLLLTERMQSAALRAEITKRGKLSKLANEEAECALQLMSQRRSNLREFLPVFYEQHRESVFAVVKCQLKSPGSEGLPLLEELSLIGFVLDADLQDDIFAWLDVAMTEAQGSRPTGRLISVVNFFVEACDARYRELLQSKLDEVLSVSDTVSLMDVWMLLLLKLDSRSGVEVMERLLEGAPVTYEGIGVRCFSSVFSKVGHTSVDPFSSFNFSPSSFLSLVRLANRHIDKSFDDSQQITGIDGFRRGAEIVRDKLLWEFLSHDGLAFWKAKLLLLEDREFLKDKSRIQDFMFERAALETESAALSVEAFKCVENSGGFAPVTKNQMFRLLIDRLDDLKSMLLEDTSPRKAWSATNDETALRQAIAHELRGAARGLYTVDQESVTADGKETDIRLRSTASFQQAVIEIKVGNNGYSVNDLLAALRGQLFCKYMNAENSQSGCLLITLAKDRKWRHPESNKLIDFEAVLVLLEQAAKKLSVESSGELLFVVVGLDFRPRLVVN